VSAHQYYSGLFWCLPTNILQACFGVCPPIFFRPVLVSAHQYSAGLFWCLPTNILQACFGVCPPIFFRPVLVSAHQYSSGLFWCLPTNILQACFGVCPTQTFLALSRKLLIINRLHYGMTSEVKRLHIIPTTHKSSIIFSVHSSIKNHRLQTFGGSRQNRSL
jgi:hypothetical protein